MDDKPLDLSELVSRQEFNFRLARFWSSPDRVPGLTIIAHVLCTPDSSDIDQIIDYFGLEAVSHVLNLLDEREEISPIARNLVTRSIRKHSSDSKSE